MINWYVESLSEPAVFEGDLTGMLLEQARRADFRLGSYAAFDEADGYGEYVNPVGGLAVARAGLMSVALDVPFSGRETVSNPQRRLEKPALYVSDHLPYPLHLTERGRLLVNAGIVSIEEIL